jgi:hypothetical protein
MKEVFYMIKNNSMSPFEKNKMVLAQSKEYAAIMENIDDNTPLEVLIQLRKDLTDALDLHHQEHPDVPAIGITSARSKVVRLIQNKQ